MQQLSDAACAQTTSDVSVHSELGSCLGHLVMQAVCSRQVDRGSRVAMSCSLDPKGT